MKTDNKEGRPKGLREGEPEQELKWKLRKRSRKCYRSYRTEAEGNTSGRNQRIETVEPKRE